MIDDTTARFDGIDGRYHGDDRRAFLKGEASGLFAEGKDTEYVQNWLEDQNVYLCSPPLEDAEIPAIIAAVGHHKTIFSAPELLEMRLPAVRWTIPGILPEGVTILAGKAKTGKSFLAFGLCLAVASGGDALGSIPVGKGDVLYLALEDNKRRLQKRLLGLLGDRQAPENLTISIEWPRLDKGGVEKLRAWLEAHPDARLVCIDILKSVRPSGKDGRNLYDVDYEALEPLKDLINDFGVAILVVHHTNQGSHSDPLQLISGSEGLVGVVDGTLVLKRERGKMDASLHVAGKDIVDEKEYGLTWDPNLTCWALAGDAAELRMSDERREILAAMRDLARPVTYAEVANHIDKSYASVRALMLKMDPEGLIHFHHSEGATKYFSIGSNSLNSSSSSNGSNSLNTHVGGGDLTPSAEGGSNTPLPESRSGSGNYPKGVSVLTDLTVVTGGAEFNRSAESGTLARVAELLEDPDRQPAWLVKQLPQCVADPDAYLDPTAYALAAHVKGGEPPTEAEQAEAKEALVAYLEGLRGAAGG